MDSRKDTGVSSVHADCDSTHAASASFNADASGYIIGMKSALSVNRNLLLDQINQQESEAYRTHSHDEKIGSFEDGSREQIIDNYAFAGTLAREVSFKWDALAMTHDPSVEKTLKLATSSYDNSSACVADSSASSVSSCSAYVLDNNPRNLFNRNEEVNSRALEQDTSTTTLEIKLCDTDRFSLEDLGSSVKARNVHKSQCWQNSSANSVEDQFEDVIFHDIRSGDTRESGTWESLYSFEPFQNSFSESPKSSSTPCMSSNSFNADSSFASPLASPLHQTPIYFQGTGSAWLVNLIDAAIQGSDNNYLHRLRRILAGHEHICVEDEEGDSGIGVASQVVDILLTKMGFSEGYNGDKGSAPPVMLGAGAAVLAGSLIPWLPTSADQNLGMSARARLVKSLALISNGYTRNRALCSAAGLLRTLLQTLSIMHDPNTINVTDEVDGNYLLDAVESLASHSLSVSDLQAWLTIAGDLIPEKISLDLICALERAMLREETKGPSYSFEFDGVDSGLLSPGEERWPFTHGYAFATWLYIERFSEPILTMPESDEKPGSFAPDINDLTAEAKARLPRLFSFLSTDKKQIEAYFWNRFLVIETTNEKRKKSTVCFLHSFNPRRWYFVGVEHTYKNMLWGKESELRLYIDGVLCETRLLELPRVSKTLEACCIGANPRVVLAHSQSRHRRYPFNAEFGPVYIFKEPIGSVSMAQLAAKGADVLPKFPKGAGPLNQAIRNDSRSSAEDNHALDEEIWFQLQFLYHPKLLVQRSCMDASPLGALAKNKRHAEVHGHVLVVHRTFPIDSIWAMAEGGPMALLPLMIGFLDRKSLKPAFRDSTISTGAALLSIPIVRIIALAVNHEGRAGEMLRVHLPLVLANLLRYLLYIPWERQNELISSITFLYRTVKDDLLKVQIVKFVLLDLKLWCHCPPEVQKIYLSSLADIVVMDKQIMRDTNAVQLLLDGCRSCYWSSCEVDSVQTLETGNAQRVVKPNSLVDELFVLIELILNSSDKSTVAADISCLVQFVLDCPQRNQVVCVLHMLSRLVRQPNSSQAALFADTLLASNIIGTFLVLLQREIEQGATGSALNKVDTNLEALIERQNCYSTARDLGSATVDVEVAKPNHETELPGLISFSFEVNCRDCSLLKRFESIGEGSEAARDTGKDGLQNNFFGDNIIVAILSFLGAMVSGGHLQLPDIYDLASSKVQPPSELVGIYDNELPESEREMWLVYSLRHAFQAAPLTLLTEDVYTALLAAVVGIEAATFASDDRISMWFFDHWFENSALLMAMLHSLPSASVYIQMRALQDMFILASTSSENRIKLTTMAEWPDWILQILISNYEATARNCSGDSAIFQNIVDLIYSFLTIILEFSMRTEDGWKDIEAIIHCAEWLTILGGSSIGEQRMRREESLPKFKRRLLVNLLDFSLRESLKEAQNVAAVAAAVAAENPNAKIAKAEAEAASYKSMSLCRNSLVLIMFVEDHLRLRCHSYSSATSYEIDVPEAMFEPYESVRCALASYGSYGPDLEEGWKYRSQLWYEIEFSAERTFGGGGRNFESWDSMMEKEENGEWIEMPLVKKTIQVIEALLLNYSCSGVSGIGRGAGNLHMLQIWENDQIFYAMLRMVLLASREEDHGGSLKHMKQSNASVTFETHLEAFSNTSEELSAPLGSVEDGRRLITSEVKVDLLECLLAPLLTKEILESRRHRVLVVLCILYAEIWHSVSSKRELIRETYLETIVPLFVRLLKRWKPLLSGTHELINANGRSSHTVEELSILSDAASSKATLTLISPMWAAAFASPTAAMALAFAAACVSEGEMPVPKFITAKEKPPTGRNSFRSLSLSTLLRSTEAPSKTLSKHNTRISERRPASEGDKEHRTTSVQALQVMNMESSVQRRTTADKERAKRWNILKMLNTVWSECFQSGEDTGSEVFSDTTYPNKTLTSLRRMAEAMHKKRMEEIERRKRVFADEHNIASMGANAWSSFVQRLLEMEALIGPILK